MSSLASGSGTRRYLAEELLNLRSDLPLTKCVIDKLHEHPDIVCISGRSEGYRNNNRSTRNRSTGDSGDSDNIFGTAPRMAMDLKRPKWSLRGRDSSDRSSQPHSAPADAAVQQSANFQRFYRAVVSPTHVRVTAGGRIVPNTRGTGPPAFDLNPDSFTPGHGQPLRERGVNGQGPNPWPHGTPVLPAYLSPIPGGPFPAFNFRQGNCPAESSLSPQFSNRSGKDNNSLELSGSPMPNVDTFGNIQRPGGLLQPIKISPPNQVDRSKPFVHNGRMMYPLTQLPNSIPMGSPMLGSPNCLPQRFPGPFPGSPQFPIPLTPVLNPLAIAPGQHVPTPIQPAIFPFPSPGLGPMGLSSQIIKSRIQDLEAHLKHIDNNSVSADDTNGILLVQLQRNAVLAHLRHMELMLDAQLAQEGSRAAEQQDDNGANSEHEFAAQPRMSAVDTQNQDHPDLSKQFPPYLLTDKTIEKHGSGKAAKDLKAKQPKPTTRPWTMNKSRLSAAAAMAPPFQPRGQASVIESPRILPERDMHRPRSSSELVPFETPEDIQKRLLSRASTSWEHPTLLSSLDAERATEKDSQQSPRSMARSQSMQEKSIVQAHNEVDAQTVQRSSTFHGKTEPSPPNSPFAIPTPYLVGHMPKHIPFQDASYSDVVYPRPLTIEEIRARSLYWGKQPVSSGQGLPKFDGMDFYPPSPVKEMPRMGSHNDNERESIGDHRNARTAPISDFDQLLAEDGATNCKSPQPIRPSTDYPSLTSTSEQHCSSDNGLGIVVALPSTDSSAGIPRPEDLSHLLVERGASVYRSPPSDRAVPNNTTPETNRGGSELLTMAKDQGVVKERGNGDGGTLSKNSSSQPATNHRQAPSNANVAVAIGNVGEDKRSNDLAVEAHSTSRYKELSSNSKVGGSFAERVANFRSVEQQTLFLQNMLKNAEATQPMTGSVLSGTVSAATASGYLPHYHGSAAASLAPSNSNKSKTKQPIEFRSSQGDLSENAVRPGADLLAENRHVTATHAQRANHIPMGSMGAEGYLLLLSQKAKKDKKSAEDRWSANTTNARPPTDSS